VVPVRFAISVQLVVLAWLTIGSACGYDDRSFDGIQFACDGLHPCPDGVACLNGQCVGSGSGSGSSSGMLGVACGMKQCPVGMACCDDAFTTLRCAALGACGAGSQELQCDGREDCSGGRSCCLAGGGTACQSGGCTGSPTICSTPADCPSAEPFCCDFPFFDVPLKYCLPVACQ
jgi:hypothetical protein